MGSAAVPRQAPAPSDLRDVMHHEVVGALFSQKRLPSMRRSHRSARQTASIRCRANLVAAGDSDARLERKLADNVDSFAALTVDAAAAQMPRLQVLPLPAAARRRPPGTGGTCSVIRAAALWVGVLDTGPGATAAEGTSRSAPWRARR